MKLWLVLTVTLLLMVITFMVQNSTVVEIRFFLWQIELPRSLLIFMTFLIGIVVGWVTRAMYRISRNPPA